ncbi:hypothetical protein OUZ56_006999 [Daphnia magna]|uniref:Uncharacterized protein n=1 Tax=Daphnia magna TaxID=35525 RepID=A0ABQ9YXA8_9CRUS|nr:hypothetical protein OUZ56_006999 [Daphnia magna]
MLFSLDWPRVHQWYKPKASPVEDTDSVNTSRQGQREKGEQLGRSREPKNHKTASPLPPRTRRTQQEKITIKKKTNIRTRNYIVEALEIEFNDLVLECGAELVDPTRARNSFDSNS